MVPGILRVVQKGHQIFPFAWKIKKCIIIIKSLIRSKKFSTKKKHVLQFVCTSTGMYIGTMYIVHLIPVSQKIPVLVLYY